MAMQAARAIRTYKDGEPLCVQTQALSLRESLLTPVQRLLGSLYPLFRGL